jgi:hypothetical protein
MARSFDGTNDRLLTADNALPSIAVNNRSCSFWCERSGNPAATETALVTCTQDGGTGTLAIRHLVPTTAGYKLRIATITGGATGPWDTPDIANAPRHIGFSYDRSSNTNDPIIYVNGVVQTLTESSPTGAISIVDDTLSVGEGSTGLQDFGGSIQHLAIDPAIWTAAEFNRARYWGRPFHPYTYHPLVTTKLADEGSAAANLTATGTTVASMVTPVVRPGSAMLGMGVGW